MRALDSLLEGTDTDLLAMKVDSLKHHSQPEVAVIENSNDGSGSESDHGAETPQAQRLSEKRRRQNLIFDDW